MYCEELNRLLETHSALTMEFFRQDARTQEFYASDEEWVAECKRLAALEEKLEQVAANLAEHRRQHRCGDSPVGTTEGSPGLQSFKHGRQHRSESRRDDTRTGLSLP